MIKPQLVLDIAGVLVTNLSDSFWRELAAMAGTTYQSLKAQLENIRRDLWTGQMKEEQFWSWLSARFGHINKESAYELLNRTMNPLPAMQYLVQFFQYLSYREGNAYV
ncbi:hypothetical protein ACFPPD_26845 [Cohnella suwonensis]|uniref:Haloacid dehalogenase n=1 Tax=Cohnella suwonensis TaxID=696072 RepID=A0ABW0M4R1_9BACL